MKGLLAHLMNSPTVDGTDCQSRNLLESVGLGLGASPRAKELVLRGIMAELEGKIAALTPQRQRGAPRKEISIDELRAATILSLKAGIGKSCRTQSALIDLAIQVENILIEAGHTPDPLRFSSGMITRAALENSVSKGLRLIDEYTPSS